MPWWLLYLSIKSFRIALCLSLIKILFENPGCNFRSLFHVDGLIKTKCILLNCSESTVDFVFCYQFRKQYVTRLNSILNVDCLLLKLLKINDHDLRSHPLRHKWRLFPVLTLALTSKCTYLYFPVIELYFSDI